MINYSVNYEELNIQLLNPQVPRSTVLTVIKDTKLSSKHKGLWMMAGMPQMSSMSMEADSHNLV